MRVVCIDDKEQYGNVPYIKRGHIYTVIDSEFYPIENEGTDYYCPTGTYYILLEMPSDCLYHESCFLPINEDQQDETEMVREYNLEKV